MVVTKGFLLAVVDCTSDLAHLFVCNEGDKMSGKRKRVVLSLGDKVKILKRLKNGEAGTKLAVEFGVGKSTISDIKKN